MFEQPVASADVTDLSVRGCADALADSVPAVRLALARRLALVAHWADTHPPVGSVAGRSARARRDGRWSNGPEDTAVGERVDTHGVGRGTRARSDLGVQLGADGTPAVAEFAAVELGMLLQVSTWTAATLLRDTLEIRHRLPTVWAGLMRGTIETWQARAAARATRVLTWQQCHLVDPRVAAALEGLSPTVAETTIDGLVVAADPAGHEARRATEAQRRHVTVSRRPAPGGLRALVLQTTGGDIARLDAMVDHLADLLAAHGDTDDRDHRRVKALVVLADPARACLLLATGATGATGAPDTESAVGTMGTTADDPGVEPVSGPGSLAGAASVAATSDEPGQREGSHREDAPEPGVEPGCGVGPESGVGPEDDGYRSPVHTGAAMGRLLAGLTPGQLRRLRPRTVLYVHLTEEALRLCTLAPRGAGGTTTPAAADAADARLRDVEGGAEVEWSVARVEGLGAVSLPELREWLGHDHVDVRPVLDPVGLTPVESYEVPPDLAEAMRVLHPHEVFPWGTTPSRAADLDHTRPWRPPGPDGTETTRPEKHPEHPGLPPQHVLDDLERCWAAHDHWTDEPPVVAEPDLVPAAWEDSVRDRVLGAAEAGGVGQASRGDDVPWDLDVAWLDDGRRAGAPTSEVETLGQTGRHNLGPLGRHHHRAKTPDDRTGLDHGFVHVQPLPGLYFWRTPTGHWFQVDHAGTRPLGTATPALVAHRYGTRYDLAA